MSQGVYLIFHKDHPLHVHGINSGAEMATRNQAKYLARLGKQVIVCAELAEAECTHEGVQFWNLGRDFDVGKAIERARSIGPYHLISAGRAIPILQSRGESGCISRTLICHDPSGTASGIRNDILCRVANGVVCVSNAQRELFIQSGADPAKVSVIHNGVDLDIFNSTETVSHDPFKLIFVGALVPHKGSHVAVDSYIQLKQKFPNLTLDLFGSADLWGQQNYLDINAIHNAIPGIRFHGAAKQEVVVQALRQSGIALIPSIWFEALGLASLEAQATGCVVVAFDVGGLKETFIDGETGVLVKEVSAVALAQAVESLLREPARVHAMSTKAAKHIRDNFNWDKVARQMVTLCEGYR